MIKWHYLEETGNFSNDDIVDCIEAVEGKKKESQKEE